MRDLQNLGIAFLALGLTLAYVLIVVPGMLNLGEALKFTRSDLYTSAGPRWGKIRPLAVFWTGFLFSECSSLTPHRFQLVRTLFDGISNAALLLAMAWFLTWAVKILVQHKKYDPTLVRFAKNTMFVSAIVFLGYIKIIEAT